MADTRLNKIIRDLSSDRQRTLTVLLGIAIGIFAFGSVMVAYSILDRELNVNYLDTNPPSAILWVDHVNKSLISTVMDTSFVTDAEARRSVKARVLVGPDTWRSLTLFVIYDYEKMRIATIKSETGSFPPKRGEILIERAAMPLIPVGLLSPITVKTPDGPPISLRVAGVVHDPAQAPANMEDTVYGYITPETLSDLGEKPILDQLMVIISGPATDENTIKEATLKLKHGLEETGITVTRIEVPSPGKHPHANQMGALLFLFEAFGVLSFALSILLTIMMINGLLAQQIRQIGIMKSLGATTWQVARLYLGGIFLLGLVATAIALPAAIYAGSTLAAFIAGMLNFNITSTAIPFWVLALITGAGLLIPPATTVFPVLRGCRITIREALNDYGISNEVRQEPGPISQFFGGIPFISRPVILSIRNTFRKKGRLAQVIFTLAAGGALFIVAMNLAACMDTTVDNALDTRHISDIIIFPVYHSEKEINISLSGIRGIEYYEPMTITTAILTAEGGTTSNQFALLGVPSDSVMLTFPILEGRWLQPGDTNAIVLNHMLIDDLKQRGFITDIHAGDVIDMTINGTRSNWKVAGIAREMIAPPRAYVSSDYLGSVTGKEGSTNAVAILTESIKNIPTSQALVSFQIHGKTFSIPSPHGTAGNQDNLFTPQLERGMQSSGMNVTTISSISTMLLIIKEHLAVISAFITFLSILVIIVGILGLVSAMNITIIERRREIGVIRAIGATPHAVYKMLGVEALVIGILSWIVAILIAPVLSVMVGNIFGLIFFKSPLDIAYSHVGMIAWLVIVLVLSPLASMVSARSTLREPVHEVLAYE